MYRCGLSGDLTQNNPLKAKDLPNNLFELVLLRFGVYNQYKKKGIDYKRFIDFDIPISQLGFKR